MPRKFAFNSGNIEEILEKFRTFIKIIVIKTAELTAQSFNKHSKESHQPTSPCSAHVA
jgi:hypothetical protein